ncbi:MAG: response regulator [Kiritimatiellia bacterium]
MTDMDAAPILVVEDDPQVAEIVVHCLQKEGFSVTHAADGRAALDRFQQNRPALTVLDLNLPKLSGKALFSEMRRLQPDCPVIMLTCQSDDIDRIVGLEMGAVDYICKPFVPRELVARVKTVLRRANAAQHAAPLLQAGEITINPADRSFTIHKTTIDLTRQEFELMSALVRHSQRIFSRDELITIMHEDGYPVTDRTVDACVKRIRRKIQTVHPDEDPIESCYGMGYRLRRNRSDAT